MGDPMTKTEKVISVSRTTAARLARQEATDAAAREIIDHEATSSAAKTARLRAARLA
jgi:hypothetical protein